MSQEEAERQALIALSEHDGMTRIFNSMTTRRMISQKISLVDLNEKHVLLLFDGDKFKQINDRYGHLIGDKVIVNIAKALKKAYKEASVIGRVGGDEFVVFIERCIKRSKFQINLIREWWFLNLETVTFFVSSVELSIALTYFEIG